MTNSLAREVLRLCESCKLYEDKNPISQKYKIKYFSDPEDSEYNFNFDLSMVDTDRIEYIQNLVQDLIEDNSWKPLSDNSDEGMDYQEYKTIRGRCRVISDPKTGIPTSVAFSDRAESDEFYKDISIPVIPDAEESPEDDFFGDDIDGGGENPMTPEEFGDAEDAPEPDETVAPRTSTVGDSRGSSNTF